MGTDTLNPSVGVVVVRRVIYVLMLCLLPTVALAFECTHANDSCSVSVHWNKRNLPFVVLANPRVPAEQHARLLAAVDYAIAQWNDATCSDMHLDFQGTVQSLADTDVQSYVTIIDKDWSTDCNDRSQRSCKAVGLTRMSYDPRNGNISKGKIELNADMFTLVDADRSCGAEPEPQGGTEVDPWDGSSLEGRDLYALLTHEFGHFLGIAHPCEFPDDDGGFVPPVVEPVEGLEDPETMMSELLTEKPGASVPPPIPERLDCHPRSCLDAEVAPKSKSTMWPELAACDTNARILAGQDVDALCYIYPAGGESTSCRPLNDLRIDSNASGCSAAGLPLDPSPAGSTFVWMLLLPGAAALRRPTLAFIRRRYS